MKEKFIELQRKVTNTSEQGILEDLKRKVNFFFKKRLNKKQAGLLKEFNETVLGIARTESPTPSSPKLKNKKKKKQYSDSDDEDQSAEKPQKSSKFSLVESEERKARMSD